jgi:hypothetical protein
MDSLKMAARAKANGQKMAAREYAVNYLDAFLIEHRPWELPDDIKLEAFAIICDEIDDDDWHQVKSAIVSAMIKEIGDGTEEIGEYT